MEATAASAPMWHVPPIPCDCSKDTEPSSTEATNGRCSWSLNGGGFSARRDATGTTLATARHWPLRQAARSRQPTTAWAGRRHMSTVRSTGSIPAASIGHCNYRDPPGYSSHGRGPVIGRHEAGHIANFDPTESYSCGSVDDVQQEIRGAPCVADGVAGGRVHQGARGLGRRRARVALQIPRDHTGGQRGRE